MRSPELFKRSQSVFMAPAPTPGSSSWGWSLQSGSSSTPQSTSSRPWDPPCCRSSPHCNHPLPLASPASLSSPPLLTPFLSAPALSPPLPSQGLLSSLQEGEAATDAASLANRGFAYQAVGCLAQRLPQLLGGRTDIAHLFFKGEATDATSSLPPSPCLSVISPPADSPSLLLLPFPRVQRSLTSRPV
jgi:hypothetical protein